MKNKIVPIKIILCTLMMLLTNSACKDFLDQSPDSREEIESPEQLTQLLLDGYSSQNYALLGELSSDNFIDNNSPDVNGVYYNLSAFNRMNDEVFAWQPAISSQEEDSPSAVWSGCYHAIAVANHALAAIEQFENEGRLNEVKAQKGEALLIRAYHHFVLTNIFCQTYKNDLLSQNDSGVPYATSPETKVSVNYRRTTVTENYKKIQTDLLEGLALIDDSKYKVPKYHFNKQAAYAFAARFFLFKRDYQQVIDYATRALGNNPATLMRNWDAEYPTFKSFADGWINVESPNNFMLLSTYSTLNRIFGTRHGCNREAAAGTIFGTGPTWTSYRYHPCFDGRLYLSGSQEYGLYFPKIGEYFEYTDKIAGIGYAHVIRAEFTAEETLLCRAEAYVHVNNFDLAIADLKVYDDSRKIAGFAFDNLSESLIRNFYKPSNSLFVNEFNTTSVAPDFVVSTSQKALLDCVLHFRRIETIFDGLRWFDIKRYGIEITHKIGRTGIDRLVSTDERRAIQLPAEVIAAGLSPNIRTKTASVSTIVKLNSKP